MSTDALNRELIAASLEAGGLIKGDGTKARIAPQQSILFERDVAQASLQQASAMHRIMRKNAV